MQNTYSLSTVNRLYPIEICLTEHRKILTKFFPTKNLSNTKSKKWNASKRKCDKEIVGSATQFQQVVAEREKRQEPKLNWESNLTFSAI